MTDSLRAEVLPPRRKSVWLLLLAPLTLAVMSRCERTERTTIFVPPVLPKVAAQAPKGPPPRVISSELKLVFREADRSFVHLGVVDAIDVDAVKRAWIGKKVFVDNDCTANVTSFEIINRVAGDVEVIEPGAGIPVLA